MHLKFTPSQQSFRSYLIHYRSQIKSAPRKHIETWRHGWSTSNNFTSISCRYLNQPSVWKVQPPFIRVTANSLGHIHSLDHSMTESDYLKSSWDSRAAENHLRRKCLVIPKLKYFFIILCRTWLIYRTKLLRWTHDSDEFMEYIYQLRKCE